MPQAVYLKSNSLVLVSVPVAIITGGGSVLTCPAAYVFSSSASHDADGNTLTATWQLYLGSSSTPLASVVNTTYTAQTLALAAGSYTLSMNVSNGMPYGYNATSTTFTVIACPPPPFPPPSPSPLPPSPLPPPSPPPPR